MNSVFTDIARIYMNQRNALKKKSENCELAPQ